MGVSYTIAEKTTLRLSYGNGYRSPNLNELTSNGYKLESGRFEVGNPNFEKEFNNQIDFNLLYASPVITIDAACFFNRISNYIYVAPTGNMVLNNTDPSELVAEYRFYQSDAQIQGGEIRMNLHPKSQKWFQYEIKYALLEGKRTNDNSFLPMMPPAKLSNTVFLNFNNYRKFTKNSFNINLLSVAQQNKVAANELKTKGFSIISLGFIQLIKN